MYDWKINGIPLQWIESVDWKSYPSKITLHCAAYPDEYEHARQEIQRFNEIAVNDINQTNLMNGGIDLQISPDGQIVIITEGDNVWQGAIEYPKFTESSKRTAIIPTDEGPITVDELIEWDITIYFMISMLPPATVYTPDFRVYPNIVYDAYNQSNNVSSVNAIGQTVSEGYYPNQSLPPANPHWNDINNVKASDNALASCVDNGPGGTNSIDMSNFGFNIPSMNVVTRIQIKIHYANNSATSSKKIYVGMSGPNLSTVNMTKEIAANTNPGNLVDAIFDTANGTIPNFSSDPATYNSSSFKIQFASNLDSYKTVWVDYIEVKVWYQTVYGYHADFSGSDLVEDFFILDGTWNEANGVLNCTGVPSSGGIGAVLSNENYQPMQIDAKIMIAPGSGVGFIFGRASSDGHYEAIYHEGQWVICWIDNESTGHAQILASTSSGMQLSGNTTYWFKVKISNNGNVQFYCNNQLQISWNKGSAIPEGKVGMRCWLASGSTFDEFKIMQTVPVDDPSFTGADIGALTIVEDRPVKSIEVIGSACNLPAWLEVNGEKHDWKFSHVHDPGDTGTDGIQTLIFTISPPDTVLEFITSDNYPPSLSGYTNLTHAGCTLKQVKVIYA